MLGCDRNPFERIGCGEGFEPSTLGYEFDSTLSHVLPGSCRLLILRKVFRCGSSCFASVLLGIGSNSGRHPARLGRAESQRHVTLNPPSDTRCDLLPGIKLEHHNQHAGMFLRTCQTTQADGAAGASTAREPLHDTRALGSERRRRYAHIQVTPLSVCAGGWPLAVWVGA
jgi:hypothetical protein